MVPTAPESAERSRSKPVEPSKVLPRRNDAWRTSEPSSWAAVGSSIGVFGAGSALEAGATVVTGASFAAFARVEMSASEQTKGNDFGLIMTVEPPRQVTRRAG